MTAAVRILLSAVNTLKKGDESMLKTLFKVVIGVFVVLLILIAAILEVLAYPADFDGDMGKFKEDFGSIVQTVEGVGSLPHELVDEHVKETAAGISDPQRKAIIETAASLIGKVPYFWGGKSAAGWNEDWNTPKKVTAAGSSSSGKYKPYGLDCSGFVDWVYRTAGIGDMLSPSPHGGIRGPWKVSYAIREEELLPGDLVIMYDPDKTKKVNHIGFFYGHDEEGKNLYIHCSSGGGGVVMNSFSGFKYFRRVPM